MFQVCLHSVILLDDSSRLFFRISSISVGPRKSQKHQNIENPCQEWVNYEAYQMKNISSANAVENVYRIKVRYTLKHSLSLTDPTHTNTSNYYSTWKTNSWKQALEKYSLYLCLLQINQSFRFYKFAKCFIFSA